MLFLSIGTFMLRYNRRQREKDLSLVPIHPHPGLSTGKYTHVTGVSAACTCDAEGIWPRKSKG